MLHSVASDLGQYYLPLSRKKNARLIKVKLKFVIKVFVWSIFEWLFYTGFYFKFVCMVASYEP